MSIDWKAEAERLRAEIDTPETLDFVRAVQLEAAHQRERWSRDHDEGKTPSDWFWLLGWLGGKAVQALVLGDVEKGRHRIIATAAACANWHLATLGKTSMRPGIADPKKESSG